MRRWLPWVVGTALWLLHALPCQAGGKVGSVFIEPTMGMATIYLQAVEIENSFVSSVSADAEITDEWNNVDPNGVIAPVGRMISYKGNGLEMSVTAGVKISGLKLGFAFSWINANFSGYSKRYRYQPELLRAGGRSMHDASKVPLFRLMGAIKYGIPVWRLMLNFQTRIGGMLVGPTPLIVGRAVEKENAFTADAGLELAIRPNKWVSVGVLGYAGAYVFPGTYEGALGAIIGVDGVLCFYF